MSIDVSSHARGAHEELVGEAVHRHQGLHNFAATKAEVVDFFELCDVPGSNAPTGKPLVVSFVGSRDGWHPTLDGVGNVVLSGAGGIHHRDFESRLGQQPRYPAAERGLAKHQHLLELAQ